MPSAPTRPAGSPETLAFLRSRRSRPAKTLAPPVPDAAELRGLLEIAARAPDHGKLVPWRFLVLERAALERIAAAVAPHGHLAGIAPEKIEKMERQFGDSHLAVAVIASPKESQAIPATEQLLSAGAVCYGLLIAALAAGWGANWLTGWAAHDRGFVEGTLGLTERESVVGIVHLGTETVTPPERPRPDLAQLTTWVEA
ncbi:MAG: nitroreductase [Deinococcus-Thermus bacterium]|jgi:nitroreductase|nr:nitroreductase [Deinococcota bacterium]